MWHFILEIKDLIKEEGLLFIFFLAACFTHNMDWGSYVYVGLIFIILVRLLKCSIKRYVDGTALLLIFFSVLYVFFSPSFNLVNSVRILLGPILFYLYGRYLVYKATYNPSHIIKIVLLMIICMSFAVWWAVLSNMLSGNIVSVTSVEGSRWVTTWGQSNKTAATTYGIIASFGLCGLGYFTMSRTKFRCIDSWLFLACSICSLLTTTYLINRSGLVIISIVTIIALFYGLHSNSRKYLVAIIPIAFILIYFISRWSGIYYVLDAYSDRSSVMEGGDRTWRWSDALLRVFTSPFGWSNSVEISYNYVHNMWLDIARVSGFLPFILMIIATFKAIKINLYFYKKKNNDLSLLLISLFTAVFLSYMIEPIVESNIFYLMVFTWIWGVEREVESGLKRITI